jgi:hypothetical protein
MLTLIRPWSVKAMLPFMLISYFNFTVKQLTTKTDDRAWYEKLEDYEGDFEFVDEDGEDGEQGRKNCDIQVLVHAHCLCTVCAPVHFGLVDVHS